MRHYTGNNTYINKGYAGTWTTGGIPCTVLSGTKVKWQLKAWPYEDMYKDSPIKKQMYDLWRKSFPFICTNCLREFDHSNIGYDDTRCKGCTATNTPWERKFIRKWKEDEILALGQYEKIIYDNRTHWDEPDRSEILGKTAPKKELDPKRIIWV